MLLRYIDDILDQILQIHNKKILSKQHYFIEAIYYYNDAIANSLCKIKDEYKKHPSTTAATYPDINIKLLLNEIEQLRRDFSYEEKERERHKKEKTESEIKSSFRQFVEKTQKTMYQIEYYVENLGLDIKITYSLDYYYLFDDLLEQLQTDLPENPDCFSFYTNEGFIKESEINLIAKRFWQDNFGATQHIDFVEFFDKFKNYVFETEKTNIDETYYEAVRRHLDLSRNLKVFIKDWNKFYTNSWNSYDFRKEFLVSKEAIPKQRELEVLNLTYTCDDDEDANKKKTKAYTLKANGFSENKKDYENHDVLKKPIIFGRKTKTFNPTICISEAREISNKQFQIAAYNNYSGLQGYYIADLSLSNPTTFSLMQGQSYILDDGSLFEISSAMVSIKKTLPRYIEDDDDSNFFRVPTHMPFSKEEFRVENNAKIVFSRVDDSTYDKKNEKEFKSSELKQDTIHIWVFRESGDKENQKDQDEEPEDDLLFSEFADPKKYTHAADIKFIKNKWVLEKVDENTQVLVYLINSAQYFNHEISYGCKLKNNMNIFCFLSHNFKVSLTQ